MKWWTIAAVGITITGILMAGKNDIRRFRQMRQM
jgi:hypothetical protein